MILWPIFGLMTLAAVFAVWWPLARGQKSVRSGSDIAVYRDQLDEIGRDQAAGLIGGVEAEAARVEVSRRLIAAAETEKAASAVAAPGAAGRHRFVTLAAAIVLLPLGAGIIYLSLGSPNLAPVSMNATADGQPPLPQGIEQTIAEVETFLEANPKNGRAWELLAPVYLRLGRFDDAVRARRNALEIFGPDAARLGDLGEAIVVASNGVVTAEAKGLFERANAADPEDVMAQYYLGLSAKQEGRRDEALKRWTALVSGAREGAEWLPMIRNAIARIDDKEPSVVAAAPSTAVAPPEHNGGAIEAMVERLAERLKKDGSDVAGWIQLVRSYRVLGKADKVKTAVADAHAALSNNQEALRSLDQGLAALETEATPNVAVSGPAGPAPTTAGVAPTGPTAGVAASGAPADHSGGAIEAMVERLAERLKKDGSDVAGWIQLVRSYRVLGKADKVKTAVADAHAALSNNQEALQSLDQGLAALDAEAIPAGPGPGAVGRAPSAASAAPPGPNASQMAAAAQMAPGERNGMIEGMVARLAQRMAENGSDVDGWLRLIKAYSVLGDRDKALAAASSARNALAGNNDNLRRIGELTKELGLEGS
jgi:cytochrome c-type biogenesis protein CcmH